MDDATPRPSDPFAAVYGCALAVTHIILTNFRSYARGELSAGARPVVLAGANGTGKTNLLEAISLLSPGRGLRGAKLSQIQRKAPADARLLREEVFADSLWAVSAVVARNPGGAWDIGTGVLPSPANMPARRTIHLNGAVADPPWTGCSWKVLPSAAASSTVSSSRSIPPMPNAPRVTSAPCTKGCVSYARACATAPGWTDWKRPWPKKVRR